jgi:DNA-binding NarL/FixJ family response regulator
MSAQDPVVLLVCDDLFFRVKLEELIRQSGRTAVTVSSREGFDNLPTYALVAVVDLKLGALPALEAIQFLRQRRPSVPVIAFGPHVEREELEGAKNSGAQYSLPRSRLVRELPDIIGAHYSRPGGESGESS